MKRFQITVTESSTTLQWHVIDSFPSAHVVENADDRAAAQARADALNEEAMRDFDCRR
jgi:hypothetical protein